MKKILFTNLFIGSYSGSEINILELSIMFRKFGYEPTVATLEIKNDLIEFFMKENIRVLNLFEEKIEDKFDIIWIQHSEVFYYMLFNNNILADKVIFSSLSPYEPNEKMIDIKSEFSYYIANSYETREKLIKEGAKENLTGVFVNSVLPEYFKEKCLINDKLNKIAIISNHEPEEFKLLKKKFKDNYIQCDTFGINGKKQLVTAELIKEYDTIITIGKSVQYGLALGVPVYCYDRFGGPGWINLHNIKKCEKFNFSGRCCNRKATADEIFMELINGYKSIKNDVDELRIYAEMKYSYLNNIRRILEIIQTKECVNLSFIREKYHFLKRQNELFITLKKENKKNNNKWIEICGVEMFSLSKSNIFLRVLEEEENLFNYILSKLKGNKIYIWGAGTHTKNLFKLLKDRSFDMNKIVLIVDSNINKKNSIFEGKNVIYSEDFLQGESKKCTDIIISSASYEEEIYDKIENYCTCKKINIIKLYNRGEKIKVLI